MPEIKPTHSHVPDRTPRWRRRLAYFVLTLGYLVVALIFAVAYVLDESSWWDIAYVLGFLFASWRAVVCAWKVGAP